MSDEQLESGLRLCGAVEVGQPLKKRLFALTHNDRVMKYSTVVILVIMPRASTQFLDGYSSVSCNLYQITSILHATELPRYFL